MLRWIRDQMDAWRASRAMRHPEEFRPMLVEPGRAIEAAKQDHDEVALAAAVRSAIADHGFSWDQVAAELGTSEQDAQQRYGTDHGAPVTRSRPI